MTTQAQLTSRQSEALKVISARQVHRKTGPTIREVAAVLDVSGNAVQGFVRKLRESGHVEPDTGNGLVVCSRTDRNDRKPITKRGGKLL